MRARSLLLALATVVATAGGLAATTTPAYAGSACPSTDPLGDPQTGTVTTAEPADWYAFSTGYPVELRMDPFSSSGAKVDMKIRNASCVPVCDFSGGFGGAQECDIPAGTYQVGAVLHSGTSASYRIEVNTYQCADGVDNDGDGRTDHPGDPGCTGVRDTTENSEPACSNNLDDDGDGALDYPADTGCASATDTVEGSSACSDGVDNDGDGRADHPADAGCTSARDETEGAQCTTSNGATVCAGYSVGSEVTRLSVVTGPTPVEVAGYVDVYAFTLPNGGVVTLPCVVLRTAGNTANACAGAGGTFVSRSVTLEQAPVVSLPAPGTELVGVGVCAAELELTVNRIGVASLPAYAVC